MQVTNRASERSLGYVVWSVLKAQGPGQTWECGRVEIRSVGPSLARLMLDDLGVVISVHDLGRAGINIHQLQYPVGARFDMTPAGLSARSHSPYFTNAAAADAMKAVEDVRRGLATLRALCAESWRGLIRVASKGAGTTAKSRKIGFEVCLPRHPDAHEVPEFRARTVLVPAAAVVEHEGKFYISRSLAMQKAGSSQARVRGIHGEVMVPAAVTDAIDRIAQAFDAGVAEVMSCAPAWEQEARRRREAREAEQQRVAEALAAAREQARLEQVQRVEQQRQAEKRRQARLTTLPTVENANVAWATWEGTRKKPVLVIREAEGCTVRYSGARVYVIEPNGTEWIKTAGNVQVNGEKLSASHPISKWRQQQKPAQETGANV